MLLTQATFYVLVIIGNIVTAQIQCPHERDEVAAGRNCEKACQPDGSCRKQNRECICDGRCGLVCLRKTQLQCQHERDEVAAGRNCERACQPDGSCKKQNRECICDGRCGPVCLRKTCRPLAPPGNGSIIIHPSGRFIGSEATFLCDDGFELIGNAVRICQANKTWNGIDPTCQKSTAPLGTIPIPATCERLPAPLNGRQISVQEDGGVVEDTVVRFHCNDGYERTSGNLRRICREDGSWSGFDVVCSPVPCPILDLEDGALAYLDKNNQRVFEPHHGDIRVAVCKDGHSLRGTSQTWCISGSWQHALPSCEVAISCPDPGVPDDGFKFGSDYSYNEIVSYKCSTLYILEGQSSIRCQANGTWNATRPTCRLIQCRRPDEPRNGHIDADLEYYGQQGAIRFDCDSGYTLRGSSVITCNEHGQWSPPPPLCVGQCRIPSCPSHGRWTINSGDWYSNCRLNKMVHPGFRLTYRCDNSYFKCQLIEPVCNDRVWEPDTQNLCVPLGCSFITLRDPQLTASYRYSGTNKCFHPTYHQQGAVAEYSCNLGYKIPGGCPNQATCVGSNWLPQQQPVCVEVTCPYIHFPNGSVTYQQNGPFTSNRGHTATAHFRCIEGYRLEGHTISCNSGIWNDTIPTCVEEPCSVASLERYDIDVQYAVPPGSKEITTGLKPAGTTANFTCRQLGFEASQTKTCERGRWRGADPVCLRMIQCRRPDEPRNGHSDADLEYYGQQGTIRFDCDSGYTLWGSSVITCNEHGQWSSLPPLCLGQCRVPLCPPHVRWTIYNGNWDSNCRLNRMVNPGFRLTYRCDIGYFKCQQIAPVCNDRVWEPDTQNLCVPLGCSFVTLRHPRLTASYTYSGANECFHPTYHQQGTVVEYSCNVGYKIRDGGPSQATCGGSSWLPQQQPVCVEVTCPYFQFKYGSVTYQQTGPFKSKRGHTATARFHCNEGYRLEGHTISCDNGIWNDTIPRCVEEPCSVASLERYNMDVQYAVPPGSNDITAGLKPADTTANFICKQYGFEASQTKRCKRGRWRGADPVCSRTCPNGCEVPIVENIFFTTTNNDAHEPLQAKTCIDRNVEPYIYAHCREGLFLQRSDHHYTCLQSGEWEKPYGVDSTCQLCRPGQCVVPYIRNGHYSAYRGGTLLVNGTCLENHRYLHVVCHDGMRINGSPFYQCVGGEFVTGNDDNIASFCSRACPNGCQVPIVENVFFTTTKNKTDEPVQPNTCIRSQSRAYIYAHCREGLFLRRSDHHYRCLQSGEWEKPNGVDSTCQPCRRGQCVVPYIENGHYSAYRGGTNLANGTCLDSGRYLYVVCHDGMQTNGSTYYQCISSEFVTSNENNILSFCSRACPNGCEVPIVENIFFTTTNNDAHEPLQAKACIDRNLEPYIYAHCREGLFLQRGDHHYRCLESGEWKKPYGVDSTCQLCRRGQCVVPYIENGHYSAYRGGTPLANGTCLENNGYLHVVCHDGMQINGSTFYQCISGDFVTTNDDNILSCCLRERTCLSPGVVNLVDMFIGSDYTPLDGQDTFREGDFLTSRCQDPKTQHLHGSIIRRCEGGRWSGDPVRCESTSFAISVANTALQTLTENGTLIVYPVRSYVTIKCRLLKGYYEFNMYKDNVEINSHLVHVRGNLKSLQIKNPSTIHSGRYSCESNRESHFLHILFIGSSDEREQSCPIPRLAPLVEMFIGNDYTTLNGQSIFRDGDFITSRCQDPKSQQLHGSVIRRCEGGRWSGDPVRCESTNVAISVGNTALQNVTENGTVIVYPVHGHVYIECSLRIGLRGTISMFKDNEALAAYVVGKGHNQKRWRINNPSPSNSGTYRCESNRLGLSIVIQFEAISCPPPEQPDIGVLTHNRANSNRNGELGFIFMETLLLRCPPAYRPNDPTPPRCSCHGTWINMSQRCILFERS